MRERILYYDEDREDALDTCSLTMTSTDMYLCGQAGSEDCDECPLSHYIGLTNAQCEELDEIEAELAEEEQICQCGHPEDDHSPSRGNACELSKACGCLGFRLEEEAI